MGCDGLTPENESGGERDAREARVRAMITVGIDASNLRLGGGRSHLVQMLGAWEPATEDIGRVIVWGSRETLALLPARPWLDLVPEPLLDGALPQRLLWQRWVLPKRLEPGRTILFAPGGMIPGGVHPVVTMSRNMLPFEASERARYSGVTRVRLELLRRAQSSAFTDADGVIFLTRYARDAILPQLHRTPKRVAVIPHGLDARFSRAPKEQRPIGSYTDQGPFRFIYVSTIEPYKHHEAVARAVVRLRARFPIAIDFVGHGEAAKVAALQNTLRSLDPGGAVVRYRGGLPFSEVHAAYDQADGIVFASSCENMPNVLLEGMATSLPVACSRRGPMPDILGDGGFYFDPESVDSIASALEALLLSADERRRRVDIATRAAERFSWSTCASDTFAFLAEVQRGWRPASA